MVLDADSDSQLENGIRRGAAQALGRGLEHLLPDAIQQAWLRVTKHISKGTYVDNPFAFGWQAGRWAALSQVERERARRSHLEEELDGESSLASDKGAGAKNIEGSVTVREILAEVRSKLTKRQAKILNYALLGHKQNWIAKRLDVSPPLVCQEVAEIKRIIVDVASLSNDDSPKVQAVGGRGGSRRGRGNGAPEAAAGHKGTP